MIFLYRFCLNWKAAENSIIANLLFGVVVGSSTIFFIFWAKWGHLFCFRPKNEEKRKQVTTWHRRENIAFAYFCNIWHSRDFSSIIDARLMIQDWLYIIKNQFFIFFHYLFNWDFQNRTLFVRLIDSKLMAKFCHMDIERSK